MGRMRFTRGLGKRKLARRDFVLAEEIGYIQRRAAECDGRIVAIGQVVLFSTDTGDAWMLEAGGESAAPLARQGIPQDPVIEETDETFTIAWPGTYRIDGDSFVYKSIDSSRTVTITGYPTRRLSEMISQI